MLTFHTSLLDTTLAAAANVELLPTLAELLKSADFLTLHTPMIASTKGLISTAELSTMKPTARVLNVARGGIIDELALLSALEAGTIAGAGIDVFTSEPPQEGDAASRLIAHPNVVATPHLGKQSDGGLSHGGPSLTIADILAFRSIDRRSPGKRLH